MKTLTLKATAVLGLMTLAACSGGGTTGGITPTPTPIVGTAPASSASADLLAYIVDGGSVIYNYESDRNNLTRLQRSEVVDGVRHTVTVDRMADGTYGLIQYAKGTDVTLYTLDDGLVASTNFPDGQYNGAFDVSYSVDGGTTWNVGTGDGGIVINTTTGQVDFGGMATASNLDGSYTSVEYFSTSEVVDGRFTDSAATVVYRENGAEAGRYTGNLEGIMLGSGADAGVVGLVGGNDGDFQANGGFTATPYVAN